MKIWLYSNIYHTEFRFANLNALRLSQNAKSGRREAAAGSEPSAPASDPGTDIAAPAGVGAGKAVTAAGRRAARSAKVTAGTGCWLVSGAQALCMTLHTTLHLFHAPLWYFQTRGATFSKLITGTAPTPPEQCDQIHFQLRGRM